MTATIATTETTKTGQGAMVRQGEPAEIETRLRAGGDAAWLTPGEVAKLFRRHRSSIDRWLNSEHGVKIGGQRRKIRYVESPGGHRTCNPDDVLWLLDEWRKVRNADQPTQPASQ